MSEDKRADTRMEQIILAIKEKDREILKSLFSKQALSEIDDFDSDFENLFEFLQGDVISWKRDGWSSDKSIDHGKSSLMLRFGFNVKTDINEYTLFVIDYNTDTISPNNEGIYMLEVRSAVNQYWGAWQERMRAGIYVH